MVETRIKLQECWISMLRAGWGQQVQFKLLDFIVKFQFFIATFTLTTQWTELALHCWQLVGKTDVYGTAPTAALHILIASPTSARMDFEPQPKLVLIYRPRKDERLSCTASPVQNVQYWWSNCARKTWAELNGRTKPLKPEHRTGELRGSTKNSP